MAAKVIFVNQNDKSKWFKVALFGPEMNRVRVRTVLDAFEARMARMEDGSALEADDDGLSVDTFAAGATYNLSVHPVVPQGEGSSLKRKREEAPDGLIAAERELATSLMQGFVSSAAASYKRWNQDYAQALMSHRKAVEEAVGEVPDVEMHRPFLRLEADPLGNFLGGILLWVRNCYMDLKEIILAAAPGEGFTILGTSGIGKSMFAVFWICYRATLKEKVLWKIGGDIYLLDFTREDSPMAFTIGGLRDARLILNDENAWLVIHGGQREFINCKCHILQVCSLEKDNYHEYAKSLRVRMLYLPVWEEEEVSEFLDEFEPHRPSWQEMQVPEKEEALRYFSIIGGIPRYVLCGKRSKGHVNDITDTLAKVAWLDEYEALRFFIKHFEGLGRGDALVHIKCGKGEDGENEDYRRTVFDFASIYVRNLFGKRFEDLNKVNLMKFMKEYANDSSCGSPYGYLLEFLGHSVIRQGGVFQMKRVTEGGPATGTEVEPLKLSKKELIHFDSWETFPEFKSDEYYKPKPEIFRSIDGVLHPDLLLQFVSRTRSRHGYIVQGLQAAARALGLTKLRVCACVPKDKYDRTGFQPWLTTRKTTYKGNLPQVILDSEQYVIAIDFQELMSPRVV